MQYEVKIEDFSADLEVEIKSSDFDLISDIQMAIAQTVEEHKESDDLSDIFDDDDEDDEVEQEEEADDGDETIILDDNEDTHTTITISRS
jgi:hypothetical protein